MSITTKAIAAAALLSIGGTLSAPAQARVDTGVAVGAGILGLGVGAAIASDHPRYYGRDYYARDDYYARPAPVYYAPPPGYYRGYERCRVVDRWDHYWGRYEPVRRCW